MARRLKTRASKTSSGGSKRARKGRKSDRTGIEALMSAAHAAGYAMAPSEGLERGQTVGLEPAGAFLEARTSDWEAVDAEAALRAAKAGPRRSRALVPVNAAAMGDKRAAADWFGLNSLSYWLGARATTA